jgi:25S rRNA (adenine2142-N1)-methyltransferase
LEYPDNGSMKRSVFLVLPLACVTNSRYLTEERLLYIMHILGFQLAKQKMTSKLHYSLWTLESMTRINGHFQIKKEELRSGATRNNFAITLAGRDRE